MQQLSYSVSQSPRTVCVKIMEYISALRQLNILTPSEHANLINHTKNAIKNQDFSGLRDYSFSLYKENPGIKQLGDIVDLLINKEETQNG